MDIEMPGMSGFDVVTVMSEDPRLKNIPVVVIPGHPKHVYSQRAADLGIKHFVQKPFEKERLLSAVTAFAERRQDRTIITAST
jgi:chemosensory pili system protein ChpA (sensor histidine kinase/response regulator)